MKNNYCVFERLFKIHKYVLFALEIMTFLYYARWESDDVLRFATKMVK